MPGKKSVADEIVEALEELTDDLKDAGVDLATAIKRMAGQGHRHSPAQRLIRKRNRRREGWRKHLRSYLVVNAGLVALNVVMGLSEGDPYPWAVFPAALWGIDVALHGIGYRSWAAQNKGAIDAAEEELAREAELAVDLGGDEGETAGLVTWAVLVRRCREAYAGAVEALEEAGEHVDLRENLESGLARVERLAKGAARIRKALHDVAPGGSHALDEVLKDLDNRVSNLEDERLRGVYQSNRALVVARKAKIEALEGEERRMRATAEGFLLAAENLRLDAARLGAEPAPDLLGLLEGPLDRLAEEVDIVRQLEAELRSL